MTKQTARSQTALKGHALRLSRCVFARSHVVRNEERPWIKINPFLREEVQNVVVLAAYDCAIERGYSSHVAKTMVNSMMKTVKARGAKSDVVYRI